MNKVVSERFSTYPQDVRETLLRIRSLIYELAKDYELGEVSETLKWGEPSYRVKTGSPVRMDWKEKTPDSYALYFNCNTSLIDTFKELHKSRFRYEGNRAIVFRRGEDIHTPALRQCLSMALQYKSLRKLPLLGGR